MKKIITVLLAAAAVAGCSNGNKYTIKGSDEAFAGRSYVLLKVTENGEAKTVDSVAIVDNSFVIEGETEKPEMATLMFGSPVPEDPSQAMPIMMSLPVFLEKGDITLKKDTAGYGMPMPVGTPLNDKQAELNSKMAELSKQFQTAAQNNDQQKMTEIQEQFETEMKSAMKANTDNLFGLSMLVNLQFNLEPQEIIDAIAEFPAELQGETVLTALKGQAETALKTQPGQPYIDIAQKDADGKEITLKSVIETEGNKYVLVDFWASWCGPCMGEVPFLVDTYGKYHKKGFEIYGVSFDNDRDAWLKAVGDKKMDWIHVSDVKGWDNQARNDYAVNGIPANFLIDCSTGKIVAKSLRGEQLQAKMAELLD